MKVVYNAEPLGYSRKAKEKWVSRGYRYIEGSWEEIDASTDFEEIEVLIVRLKRKVDESILNKFLRLKYVVSATTGHDHLDLSALSKKKIELISLRGHSDFLNTIPSTAEHTWALMMSLLRNIPQSSNDVRDGRWDRDAFRGYQLKNKTLGIIGLGRTGTKVAEYAKAFSMRVIYYDPFVETTAELTKFQSVEDLVSEADIISLHVHLNDETHHLINQEVLRKLKKGSYLINTSRGKVCDEAALVNALLDGKLTGVATDVLYHELTDFKSSPLWKYAQTSDNVIITPHIGGATWDAMHACEEFLAGL